MSSNIVSIRCHKCRMILYDGDESLLLNSHGENFMTRTDDLCQSVSDRSLIFISEETLSKWIREKIEIENWTKGKLHCQDCGCKVGSFDFITGRHCVCGNFVIPSVHFIKSQVDIKVPLVMV